MAAVQSGQGTLEGMGVLRGIINKHSKGNHEAGASWLRSAFHGSGTAGDGGKHRSW